MWILLDALFAGVVAYYTCANYLKIKELKTEMRVLQRIIEMAYPGYIAKVGRDKRE